MIIHLYAQCWNDEWMLPFFFRHYDRWVDRYFIYDDGSSDATWSILESHPKVEARRFEHSHPDSFVLSEQSLSNHAWKQSRGEADWVIVTDIDEHLMHPAGEEYFTQMKHCGVTVIPSLGYQMISEAIPEPQETLAHACPFGAPWVQMMKPSMFDPSAIEEIRFAPGRHSADPTGEVRVPEFDELLLLHFKYIGFERTLARHRHLKGGLGPVDRQNNWGHKYSWTDEELKRDWEAFASQVVDIRKVGKTPATNYPIAPWWDKYRKPTNHSVPV